MQIPLLSDLNFLPSKVKEFFQPYSDNLVVPGTTLIHEPNTHDVNIPTLIGKLELDSNCIRVGTNISHDNDKGVIIQVHPSSNFTVKFGGRCKCLNEPDIQPLKTAFRIYIDGGISFSFGGPVKPAGHGHTLIWDSPNQVVRCLSALECWLISGGSTADFPISN